MTITRASLLTYALVSAVLAGALALIAAGPVTGIAAVGFVLVVVALVVGGPENIGFGFLGLAFFTAPFYKGTLATLTPATPTDFLLAVAVVLLVPRLLVGGIRLAPPYVLGIALVLTTGVIASAASANPTTSLLTLALWLVCLAVVPLVLSSLQLSTVAIDRLAWAFVGGHMLSIAVALVSGPVTGSSRYQGLTQHPNAFAQSGVLSFALLLHLLTRARGRGRWLVYAAMTASLVSVYISGSRAGTVTVAVLVLLVPVVERSALVGYLLSFAGVGVGIAMDWLVRSGRAGGSLERLVGDASSTGSDQIRSQTLSDGLERLGRHPLLGNGLLDLDLIHNNYVEVAVAIGVIGFVGFVLVIWSVGRGLLGRSDLRRLCYPAAAYAVFGATIPALNDRSIWMAIALGVAAFRGFAEPTDARPASEAEHEPERLAPAGRVGPAASAPLPARSR